MSRIQIEGETVIIIIPEEAIAFPAAERLRANIMKLSGESECNVILDCKNLKRLDITVAKVGNEIPFERYQCRRKSLLQIESEKKKCEHERTMITVSMICISLVSNFD